MNDATDRIAAPSRHKLPAPCGAHVIARALKRHGVEVMFGQSLPSALYLVAPEFGIRQIAYRTENAGGSMADGYARATNKVGVVTAQNGPAAALLVSPLAEALKASDADRRDRAGRAPHADRQERVSGARSLRHLRAAARNGCAA